MARSAPPLVCRRDRGGAGKFPTSVVLIAGAPKRMIDTACIFHTVIGMNTLHRIRTAVRSHRTSGIWQHLPKYGQGNDRIWLPRKSSMQQTNISFTRLPFDGTQAASVWYRHEASRRDKTDCSAWLFSYSFSSTSRSTLARRSIPYLACLKAVVGTLPGKEQLQPDGFQLCGNGYSADCLIKG